MKTYFISIALCVSCLGLFAQKLELEKASPFTAVKWENEQPIVKFENEWYYFEKLDKLSKEEILEFCKKEYGSKWKKRFSEDLVEVLQGLEYQPNIKVPLQLFKEGVLKRFIGTFTFENRQRSLAYNKENLKSSTIIPQKLAITEALTDLKQFETLLHSRSSYAQLSEFDYVTAIHVVASAIKSRKNGIDIDEFTNELAKIMAEIGDRHASVKNKAFFLENDPTNNLKLPFGVTAIDGKLVALKQNKTADKFTYYKKSYPYLVSINGIPTDILITYNYNDKKAPARAKLARGSSAIENYGALLFKNNKEIPDSMKVVFSDGFSQKTQILQLTTQEKGYYSKVAQKHGSIGENVKNGNFDDISKRLDGNIGYINIPEMFSYHNVEGLEKFIEKTLQSFSDTKALIIDIRNNPGGTRELLQTFAPYIIQPEQSPWIANVAFLRTDKTILGDEDSMSSRYLYSYNSKKLTDKDRNAIDQFNIYFKPQKAFDTSKFSLPFYMVLHNRDKSYKQPVYILVNENSFSAASVFTSAFKGLPNVKIAGVTTDGSSGNSKVFFLKHSNIRVKVSTMLSFQRNGKTLDGNGTAPDIRIPEEEIQVLEGVDLQLDRLITSINDM